VRLSNAFIRLIDRATQEIYRLSAGRIGTRQLGWSVLLLTTIGRRSGRPRRHALVYLRDGERLLVVASNNGGDAPPAWLLNLGAYPRALVQEGPRTAEYTARIATAEERALLWERLVAYHAPYADHQAHTRRELAVVILTPALGAADMTVNALSEHERAEASPGGYVG